MSMGKRLQLRDPSVDERRAVEQVARSRTAPERQVERAKVVLAAAAGEGVGAIAERFHLSLGRASLWWHRFEAQELAGLQDQSRGGRTPTSTREPVGIVVQTALTDPQTLGLAFASWTLDRLAAYLGEQKGIAIKRSRIDALLIAEGLRWRQQETWVGFAQRVDPAALRKEGHRTPRLGRSRRQRRRLPRRAGSASGEERPGHAARRRDPRAPPGAPTQEIDDGRRGNGYIFGAFQPATGEAFTWTATQRTTANFVAFLEETERWIDPTIARVYAILDNLKAHRGADVLLCALAGPSPVGVCLPAQVRRRPEPDRPLVEDLALAGAQRQAV
jgi:transposase